MDRVKQAFSIELVEGLKRVYGGHIPSMAKISRDFSLKSPHLPHVSTETIRKWIRGESLPHISRMQVLVDWLGPQIAIPFEQPTLALQYAKKHIEADHTGHVTSHSETASTQHEPRTIHDQLVGMIDQLNEIECKSILAIAKLLTSKRDKDDPPIVAPQNGHGTIEI